GSWRPRRCAPECGRWGCRSTATHDRARRRPATCRRTILTTFPRTDPMIEVDTLTRSFGSRRRATTPLDGVSHTFRDGTLTYLLGLNGTGKSTLLRCMGGVLTPQSGT